MVLGAGDDDLVPLPDDEALGRVVGRSRCAAAGGRSAQAGVPDGQGDEVDGLSGVLGEDQLGAACADEGGDGVTGVLESGGPAAPLEVR